MSSHRHSETAATVFVVGQALSNRRSFKARRGSNSLESIARVPQCWTEDKSPENNPCISLSPSDPPTLSILTSQHRSTRKASWGKSHSVSGSMAEGIGIDTEVSQWVVLCGWSRLKLGNNSLAKRSARPWCCNDTFITSAFRRYT